MDQISAYGDAAATTRPARPVSTSARLVIALDRVIYRIARHWLLAVNTVFVAHVATLVLAPALVAWGHGGLARPIYAFNGLFCHQRGERSFTVLGEQMACCQRCTAIYAAIMFFGLIFALARGHVRAPRLGEVALLALPVVVDGGAQLVGLWESTPGTRVLSGAFLGVALCWLLLPYLDTGFARMRAQLEALFARLAAEGRARPL